MGSSVGRWNPYPASKPVSHSPAPRQTAQAAASVAPAPSQREQKQELFRQKHTQDLIDAREVKGEEWIGEGDHGKIHAKFSDYLNFRREKAKREHIEQQLAHAKEAFINGSINNCRDHLKAAPLAPSDEQIEKDLLSAAEKLWAEDACEYTKKSLQNAYDAASTMFDQPSMDAAKEWKKAVEGYVASNIDKLCPPSPQLSPSAMQRQQGNAKQAALMQSLNQQRANGSPSRTSPDAAPKPVSSDSPWDGTHTDDWMMNDAPAAPPQPVSSDSPWDGMHTPDWMTNPGENPTKTSQSPQPKVEQSVSPQQPSPVVPFTGKLSNACVDEIARDFVKPMVDSGNRNAPSITRALNSNPAVQAVLARHNAAGKIFTTSMVGNYIAHHCYS